MKVGHTYFESYLPTVHYHMVESKQGGKPTCRPGRVKLTSPVFTLVPDISTLLRVKWNFYYTKVGYFMNPHLVLWSEDLNIQNC